MMSWLGAIALLVTGQAASNEEAQLSTRVAQSNDCLKKQVDQLVLADKISLSDQVRSTICVAAAKGCRQYDAPIAALTADYRSGQKPIDQATEDMLATSLRIADAMALTCAKTNAGNAK